MRKFYWWISTKDEGKPYLVFGSERSEEEARQKAFEILGGLDFEIKKLPTRDLGTASSMIRGNRLERTKSLKEASKRIGHSKSLKRLKHQVKQQDRFKNTIW